VITGADRVCANGDAANKIGTLAHAVAARHFGARFMVVCPWSTVDMNTPDGSRIEIEERAGEELLSVAGQRIAAPGAQAWNPVFDVTPAELIDVLVTERGAIEKPDREKIAALR
jgi:methylthioribose-1-phosphate isomerase